MKKIEGKGVFGSDIYQFETLDSTNDYLLENYKKHKVGDIIWAEDQTKGRGRRANVWKSSKGKSLTYSYLLDQKPYSINNISQVLSLSLCVFLKEVYKIESQMKWPNDVMIGDKKVSGMLIEMADDFYVIGHGINMLGEIENSNDETKQAASIFKNEETSPSIEEFLIAYVQYVGSFLEDFSKNGFQPFYHLWVSFFWMNKKTLLLKINDSKMIEAEVVNLMPSGELHVRERVSGKERLISSGEVWL